MHDVFIGLGSNSGDREAFLKFAVSLISSEVGAILKASHCYETAAWGMEDQPAFLNQVLFVKTPLKPDKLLFQLLQIEKKAGRIREVHWGPRTLDLDILLFDDLILDNQDLVIPHPQLANRNFVLVPLHEIAPEWIHPVSRKSMVELLRECEDSLAVKMWINH